METLVILKRAHFEIVFRLNLTVFLAWRKIFESNPKGKVEFVLWGLKETLVVTSGGTRVQAFNYINGFANWEYALFNNKPGSIDRFFFNPF